MGAHDFHDTIKASDTITSAQSAYDYLVAQAEGEYGHSGYNGTISTTYGFTMAERLPVTLAEGERIANKAFDNDECQKREAALCVEYYVPELKDGRSSTKTVTLDGTVAVGSIKYRKAGDKIDRALAKEIAAKAGVAYDEHAVMEFVTATQKFKKASAPTGKGTKTVYDVVVQGRVSATKDTMAQARASMEDYLTRCAAAEQATEATVVGRVVRDEADSLVTGSVVIDKTTITVKITPRTKTGKVTERGWYFFGMAAS